VEDQFGVPYRSLANHLRKHLDVDHPTVRGAIEAERFIAWRNRELGVEVAIAHRELLDRCIEAATFVLEGVEAPNL
jgi:hypothetical protein